MQKKDCDAAIIIIIRTCFSGRCRGKDKAGSIIVQTWKHFGSLKISWCAVTRSQAPLLSTVWAEDTESFTARQTEINNCQ